MSDRNAAGRDAGRRESDSIRTHSSRVTAPHHQLKTAHATAGATATEMSPYVSN